MTVPNRFPTRPSARRIALIGEAPGADEVSWRRCPVCLREGAFIHCGNPSHPETVPFPQPFVGASGRFLSALLSKAGLSREACFLGNVSQHRPPNNDFSRFSWNGMEVQHGLTSLREDLDKFRPHLVVLLGNVPLRAAKDPMSAAVIGPKGFRFKNSNWRGYMFLGEQGGPFSGMKCLSTMHPA